MTRPATRLRALAVVLAVSIGMFAAPVSFAATRPAPEASVQAGPVTGFAAIQSSWTDLWQAVTSWIGAALHRPGPPNPQTAEETTGGTGGTGGGTTGGSGGLGPGSGGGNLDPNG